jgi:hypothetical protein
LTKCSRPPSQMTGADEALRGTRGGRAELGQLRSNMPAEGYLALRVAMRSRRAGLYRRGRGAGEERRLGLLTFWVDRTLGMAGCTLRLRR